MANALKPGIWFVRSNGGSGSYPVTREGWNVVWAFLAGVVLTTLVAVWLVMSKVGLWWVVFVAGLALSAAGFILVARPRTDFSITFDEYRKPGQ